MAKLAEKFLGMAKTLEGEIAHRRGPRRENTPKQCKEATSARIDAHHLERVKNALERLAKAHETGAVPPGLEVIKSKADLMEMLRTRLDCSGGYYSIRDTGEYPDQSPVAMALRSWLNGTLDPVKAAEDARRRRIEELELDVKFRPIPGFFPTPPAVIERMLELADVQPGMWVLEPSAGKGDIADAIRERLPDSTVWVAEVNPRLCDILDAKGHRFTGSANGSSAMDFLQLGNAGYLEKNGGCHDRVVMNPPFESGQDMDHVRHAYAWLKPGGRLVSVMSTGAFFRTERKAQDFREWFDAVGGEKFDLPEGAFKNGFRSTGVNAVVIVIEKGT